MKNYLHITFLLFLFSCSAQTEQKEFYENGELKSSLNFNKMGELEGEEKSYYRNGRLKKIVHWKNGEKVDSLINYDRLGNINSIGFIRRDSLKIYRTDESIEFAVRLKNGKEHGTGIYYDRNNKPLAYSEFVSGTKEGISLYLRQENLKPQFIANFKDNEIEGLLIDFYDNGVIKSLREMPINGEGKGKIIEFYENGTIKNFVMTIDGKANGYEYRYNDDGSLLSKNLYLKGNKKAEN